MPCMGPDKTHSEKVGEEIASEFLALLKSKGIGRPDWHPLTTMIKDWDDAEKKFVDACKELVWAFDSASF